jgi:TonB family protein
MVGIKLPGGRISMPTPAKKTVPSYPDLPNAVPQGTVEIEVVVNGKGAVVNARVVTAISAEVGELCRRASEQWTFDPAIEQHAGPNGSSPVTSLVILRFEFTPPRDKQPGTVVATVAPVRDGGDLPADQQPSSVGKVGDAGLTSPTLLRSIEPSYTDGAMRALIQGDVDLEAVVMPDGTVGKARVIKSLDQQFGLDDEALRVARHWLFKPGTRDGQPVPVLVKIILSFRLH